MLMMQHYKTFMPSCSITKSSGNFSIIKKDSNKGSDIFYVKSFVEIQKESLNVLESKINNKLNNFSISLSELMSCMPPYCFNMGCCCLKQLDDLIFLQENILDRYNKALSHGVCNSVENFCGEIIGVERHYGDQDRKWILVLEVGGNEFLTNYMKLLCELVDIDFNPNLLLYHSLGCYSINEEDITKDDILLLQGLIGEKIVLERVVLQLEN